MRLPFARGEEIMPSMTYRPSGVCARSIFIETEGDIIKDVQFEGGCNGNLKAIGKLVSGKNIDEIADLLEGNTCGMRPTSCADQLSRALREVER